MNHCLYKLMLLSLVLFSTSSIQAENQVTENTPLYDGSKLIIPRVDTINKVGAYQEATFVYNNEINAWQLQSYDNARDGIIRINHVIPLVIDIKTPVQVLLQISGELLGCGDLGRIDQRMTDNKFEIRIYTTQFPDDSVCGAAAIPFLKVIPLNVYGLDAGIYEYSINGGDTRTFQLLHDNRFAECYGIEECNQVITAQ